MSSSLDMVTDPGAFDKTTDRWNVRTVCQVPLIANIRDTKSYKRLNYLSLNIRRRLPYLKYHCCLRYRFKVCNLVTFSFEAKFSRLQWKIYSIVPTYKNVSSRSHFLRSLATLNFVSTRLVIHVIIHAFR